MIDTICLLLPKEQVRLLDPTSPNWDLFSKTDQYDKYVKNPSKKNLDSGLYFPRLTGYKRKDFFQTDKVRIEFSVPKLLYLNNLEELEDRDFPKVIETLRARLETMSVTVARQDLESATVSSVHFSKNIQLEDGYTTNHLISEMGKIDMRKVFDFTRVKYVNDGQSLYAHTTSHQLIIYDKVADLAKGKKRAVDKDQPAFQQSLFAELKKAEEMIEIIRFEVRINHKQKLNHLLGQLGYQKNPTFKEVFSVEMSKQVVNDYWKKIIKGKNQGPFSMALSLKDVLRRICVSDSKIKPKQAIYLVGLFMLGKDENGMRELRSIVSKRSHDRTWYRIAKDMQEASKSITQGKVRDWVVQIEQKLKEYAPYKYKKVPTP